MRNSNTKIYAVSFQFSINK